MSEENEKRMYFIMIITTLWTVLCIVGFFFIFESYNLSTIEQRKGSFFAYMITMPIVTFLAALFSEDLYI